MNSEALGGENKQKATEKVNYFIKINSQSFPFGSFVKMRLISGRFAEALTGLNKIESFFIPIIQKYFQKLSLVN